MNKSMYELKLSFFEKKNHEELVNMFKELDTNWRKYPLKYNKKISINYTNFVKYCFSITEVELV